MTKALRKDTRFKKGNPGRQACGSRNKATVAVEALLAEPEVCEGSKANLMELQIKLSEVKHELGNAEQAWLAASNEIEAVN